MTSATLTPFYDSEAVDLGNRMWRRQILPVGDVNYKGRVLRFTKNYLQKLAQSFKDGAYAQVPFQLADKENSHTNDPERFRGDITAMEVRDDGLWATAELSERGDALLRENPKLGVSARIVEDYDRADGKHFDRAVQHVLGTMDPRVTGMKPWEAISLSNSDLDVLDLSAAIFIDQKEATMADTKITDEQRAAFDLYVTELVSLDPAKPADGKTPVTATSTDADIDAELEALLAEALAEEGAPAELSADSRQAIELANARIAEMQTAQAATRAELDLANFEREKAELLHKGVPPVMVDLAMPLLLGKEHTIDLSNGTKADAGSIIRELLKQVEGTVDLSSETMPASGSPAADKTGALLDKWEKQFPAGIAK